MRPSFSFVRCPTFNVLGKAVAAKNQACDSGKKFGQFAARQWSKLPDDAGSKEISGVIRDVFVTAMSLKKIADELQETQCFSAIKAVFERSWGATQEFSKTNAKVREVCAWFKPACLLAVPFAMFDIGKNIYNGCTDRASRVDCVLSTISSVGSILSNTARTIDGLAALGFVSAGAVILTGPLSVIGALSGVSCLAATSRNIYLTYKFSEQFRAFAQVNEAGFVNARDFEQALKLLMPSTLASKRVTSKHGRKLAKHFGVQGTQLIKDVKKCYELNNYLTPIEKTNLIKIFQRRIKVKQFSNTISLLAGTISLVGNTILVVSFLVFPPLAPLGFAAVAVGGLFSIGRFGFEFVNGFKFNREIMKVISAAQKRRT